MFESCPDFSLIIGMAGGHYSCGVEGHILSSLCHSNCSRNNTLIPCPIRVWVPRHDTLRFRCSREEMGWYCPYHGNATLCRFHSIELSKKYDDYLRISEYNSKLNAAQLNAK